MKKILFAIITACVFCAGVKAQTQGTGAVIESETLKVWFDNITLVADGKTITTMTVYEKDIYNYTAFNMAFTVPEGITVAKVKKGRETVNDIEMSARATTTHSISVGQPDPDLVKVLAFSSQLEDLYPDDEDGNEMEELYTIGFIASPQMANGNYDVEMWDIKFVLANTDACVPKENSYKGVFTITGSPTSVIDSVADSNTGDEVYYDLQGRPVSNKPAPGIYICNGEKVVVK